MSENQIPASGSAVVEPVDTTRGFGSGAFGAPEEAPKVEQKVEAPKQEKSPASDLRDIQSLLVMGIFPGQMAPAVVKAYQLLEHMAVQVEADAKK